MSPWRAQDRSKMLPGDFPKPSRQQRPLASLFSPTLAALGASWACLGASWAAPAASLGALGPLLQPPGPLLVSILPFRGPPLGASWAPLGPPGGPPSHPGHPKKPPKHEKSTKTRKVSYFTRFQLGTPRFRSVWLAKSSENAGLPAETSYFTRVLGCIFTLFSSPGKLKHTCFTCVQLFLR